MEAIQTLGRTYSVEILGATDEPKSVVELSDSLDVPVATCYRRVGELVSAGLLEKCPAHSDTGTMFYRRTTDAVGIRFGPMPSIFTWAHINAAGALAPGVTAENESFGPTLIERSGPQRPDVTGTDD